MIYKMKVFFRKWIHEQMGGDYVYNPRGDERAKIGYDALVHAPFPFPGYIVAFNYPTDDRFVRPDEYVYDWDRK